MQKKRKKIWRIAKKNVLLSRNCKFLFQNTMILHTEYLFLTNEIDGFRHCRETLSESSSTMLLCKKGYIDVFFHDKMLRVGKDDLLIRIPRATELGPYEMSDDFEFIELAIPNKIFEDLMFELMRVEPLWWQKQEYLKANPLFHLSDYSKEFCEVFFHLLTLQVSSPLNDYRRQILKLMARSATLEILNYLDRVIPTEELDVSRLASNTGDYTFHTFTKLLRENPHKREVQWYAEQIGITPKYLSEICKERSGKSASEWIADVTIAELKHLLRDTTIPIHEVAKQLEFPNASFFCQYTKKHTGLTPNKFRKERKS